MVARRRRVEHQPTWRRCPRHRPTRSARSRSSGRNHRRSSASAGGGGPRASRPRCPGTSTRPASGGWPSAPSSSLVWIVVVATGNVAHFDVADTRILQAIADLRTPWLTRVARGRRGPRHGDGHLRALAGEPGSSWSCSAAGGTCSSGSASASSWSTSAPRMASTLQRPRPYEVEILGALGRLLDAVAADDGARRLPGEHGLLARPGRPVPHDRPSGWSAACWLITGAVPALPRAGPPDRHRRRGDPRRRRAAGRLPAADPQRRLPVRYKRGRPAHLDVTGVARRRHHPGAAGPARPDRQPGEAVRARGVGRLDAAEDHREGRPGHATCSASSTRRRTCAPTAGTSSAAPCCTAGWRTSSRSTACAGWSSTRTTSCA